MRITIDFDNWDEMEAFRTSGRKTRTKKEEAAEAAEEQAAAPPAITPGPPATFTPPVTPVAVTPAPQGFPGANGTAAPAVNPLAIAIADKADNAIAGGQDANAVLMWFRQTIGPDATNATWDQIKSVYLPRLPNEQLVKIAPQLGITG
jgi:hypothetical protein